MGRRLSALATVAMACLAAAPSALARDENGNRCVADASEANWTLAGFSRGLPPSPYMPRTGTAGVITSWEIQVGPGLGPLAQQLVIFRQAGEQELLKLAESAIETVREGHNEFAARIPVPQLVEIGLHGPEETFYCSEEQGALSGLIEGDFALGESRPYKTEDIATPVAVIVEPDWDGDGYGDETQDGCAGSAAIQDGCPTVTPTAVAKVEPGAIVLSVRTDSEGLVKATGQTGWRLPPKAKRGGKASKRIGRRFVALLKATEEKAVLPGSETVFRVPLPKSVKRRLGDIKPGRSLNATITVTATDLAYRETSTTVTVKLHGRKPARSKR